MIDSDSDHPPLLRLRRLSKSFPGVKALSEVDFTLCRGEIHALMGENGGGKSTLIKVLTGVHPRDDGEMELDGVPIDPLSPQHAQALGISTVYQEVNLVPQLSVAENILLGRQPTRLGCVQWKEINRRAEAALARLGLQINVTASLSSYSIAIQQLVAIARALDAAPKILILDEPTSSLDANEVDHLFAVLRRLKSEGLGIIFVTHFLDQVYAIADRITVLRNGQLVGEYETSALPRLELISRMIGREISEQFNAPASRSAPGASGKTSAFLQARGLGKRNSIAPFDLEVREGEIIGLAGLLGSGRTEMARLLFGIDQPDQGEIHALDQRRVLSNPRQAIRLRFGFSPEDRKNEGIIPNLSVRENIILALQSRRGWLKSLSREQQNAVAAPYIRSLQIVPADAERPIKFLSGGNQQKALLARWLASDPNFLIVDEPTRGIDVGAKAEIEKLIRDLAANGMAILFISSELDEVVRNSHRVVVLRDRKKITELAGEQVSETAIMQTIAAPPEEDSQRPTTRPL